MIGWGGGRGALWLTAGSLNSAVYSMIVYRSFGSICIVSYKTVWYKCGTKGVSKPRQYAVSPQREGRVEYISTNRNSNCQGPDDKRATSESRALPSVHTPKLDLFISPNPASASALRSHRLLASKWKAPTIRLATALFLCHTTMAKAIGVVPHIDNQPNRITQQLA